MLSIFMYNRNNFKGGVILTLTADAVWLNTVFAGYDHAILSFTHRLAEIAGFLLTPFAKFITLLGEKGLLLFLLAFFFMLFPRWRRTGLCMFGAICCGALITNIILKDSIARPRPFEISEQFRQWWEFVGSPAEDGFSFPSGHVTAAAAGMTSLCLMKGKRWFIPGTVWVLFMMFSRNYLMAHYPSDVLFAMFIGIFSGFVAAVITQVIFYCLERNSQLSFLTEIGYDSPAELKDRIFMKISSARQPSSESYASVGKHHKDGKHTGNTSGFTYQGKH